MTTEDSKTAIRWTSGIVLFMLVFMIALGSFAYIGTRQKPILVQQNYYEEGVKFQDKINARQRANSLKDQPAMIFNGKSFSFSIPQKNAENISLYFYRNNDHKLDKKISVEHPGSIPLEELVKGWWKVTLDWTVDDELYSITKDLYKES